MANWLASSPKDTDNEQAKGNFAREVWTRFKFGRIQWTPSACFGGSTNVDDFAPSGAPNQTQETTGLRVGMAIHVTPPDMLPTGMHVYARVPVDDQLTIYVANTTGGLLTAPSGEWSFMGVIN